MRTVIYRCQSCGAVLNIDASENSHKCEYCETPFQIKESKTEPEKRCKFCKSKIHYEAVVCPVCNRSLPEPGEKNGESNEVTDVIIDRIAGR